MLGSGTVIDIEHLITNEIAALRKAGITVTPGKITKILTEPRSVCHHRLGRLEEDRLAEINSVPRRGRSLSIPSKYMKKTIRYGDLKRLTDVRQHIADIVEWKNLMIVGGYGKSKIETQSVMNCCIPTVIR